MSRRVAPEPMPVGGLDVEFQTISSASQAPFRKPSYSAEDHGIDISSFSMDTPVLALLALNCAISLQLVFNVVSVGSAQTTSGPSNEYGSLVIRIVLVLMGWAILWAKSNLAKGVLRMSALEEVLAVALCVGHGIIMSVQQSSGECDCDGYHCVIAEEYCNPLYDQRSLPVTSLLLLALLPVVLDGVFPSLRWRTACACFLICISFLIGNLIAAKATNSIMPVIWAIVFDALTLVAKRFNRKQWKNQISLVIKESIFLKHESLQKVQAESNASVWRGMLASISHDLKTPLAAFNNGCELLASSLLQLQAYRLPREATLELDNAQSSLQGMRSISCYMSMMLHRCIDYTKASNGVKLVPFLQTVDLTDCLTRALACVRDLQPRCRLELRPLPMEMCHVVSTDQQWLLENVLCLAANGVKYSPQGSTVTVRVIREGDWTNSTVRRDSSRSLDATPSVDTPQPSDQLFRIEVEDNGVGVPEHLRGMMFEEEFCHLQRLSGGTGLGLYALARRCEALGGKYGISNRMDGRQGSVFWFSIPYIPVPMPRVPPPIITSDQAASLTAAAEVAVRSLNTHAVVKKTKGWNRSLHVLVAEDSLPILRITCSMLERDGHTVVVAQNGQEVLDTLEVNEQPFDVILMDIQMPIMDGLESTRQIRLCEASMSNQRLPVHAAPSPHNHNRRCASKDPEDAITRTVSVSTQNSSKDNMSMKSVQYDDMGVRPIFIIGCSANADPQTIEQAYAAGVDEFLPKPFQLTRFKDLVHHHYRRSLLKERPVQEEEGSGSHSS